MQATQYLKYIAHPPLTVEIQTKLNSTLQKAFKRYGQPTNLQAHLGIPPLIYTRHKDLIRDLILNHSKFLFHGTNSLGGKAIRHKNHHKSNPAVLTRESIIIEPRFKPLSPASMAGILR